MICLTDIQYLYDPRTPSGVSQLSLQIKAGSLNALIGPSGSGKSTLLNILAGKVKPQSGKVELPDLSKIVFSTDLDIESQTSKVLDYLVSKFQSDQIEEFEAINKARDLLHEFEITHTIQKGVHEISRGEGERLWLAGLLMNNPEVILLDEAFNGLDWQNRHLMLSTLLNLTKEKNITIIWATQLLEEALRYSNNVVLLQYGRIQQQGTPQELIQFPQNRFVAQFVGRKNLILVNPENHQSEFGPLELEVTLENDGILILDPFLCGEGTLEAKVLESYYDYGRYINVLEFNEKTYLGHSHQQLTPDQKTKFSLNTQNSYLLPEV